MSTAKRRLSEEAERVNPIQPVHIWRTPPGSAVDMLIVTHLPAYTVIHNHSVAALPNETGGFLIGRVACDQWDGCWHIEIEEAVPVVPESQDPVHFTFTWRDVDRVRTYREGQGKALVGWFHTHPDLEIFLSETDLDRTHRVLFTEPFQVALVYDPTRGRAGYFYWEGAQQIDASSAGWREFDIAVEADPEAETPIPADAPAAADPPAPLDAAADETPAPSAAGPAAPRPRIELAPDQPGQPEPAAPDAPPRRLRAVPADSDEPLVQPAGPGVTGLPGAADVMRTTPSPRPGAAPNPHKPRRFPWLFMLAMLMVIVCGAMGYFWLFPLRAAQ